MSKNSDSPFRDALSCIWLGLAGTLVCFILPLVVRGRLDVATLVSGTFFIGWFVLSSLWFLYLLMTYSPDKTDLRAEGAGEL